MSIAHLERELVISTGEPMKPEAIAIDRAHKTYQLALDTPDEAAAFKLLRDTVNGVQLYRTLTGHGVTEQQLAGGK